jgi:peptidoglycan/xylan/chitin deacetylase (PgdA/CDA1 family)
MSSLATPPQTVAAPDAAPEPPLSRLAAGALVISLDFELYWGVRDQRTLDQYRENLMGVRQAVPAMLDLFARRDVHATWSTVGFLFFDGLDDLMPSLPERRPDYRDPKLDPYADLRALHAGGESVEPFRFAPSLIRRIAATPGQEIATHTFSHYYCLEDGQTPEAFEDDLRAAARAAARHGLSLHSLVFPRNQVNPVYLPICARLGLRSYRGNERSWMYPPNRPEETPWYVRAARLIDAYVNLSGHNAYAPSDVEREPLVNLPSSRFLRPYSRAIAALEPLRMRRIRNGLTHAARRGLVYHLWWHPENFGADTEKNLAFLEGVLDHFDALRERHDMASLTMGELAELLAPAGTGQGGSDGV